MIVWIDHDPGDHDDAAGLCCPDCGVERRGRVQPHYDVRGIVIGIATVAECRDCCNWLYHVALFGGRR